MSDKRRASIEFADDEISHKLNTVLKACYEDGSVSALFEAIAWSIQWRRSLPDWAAKAYLDGFNRLDRMEAKSLDDAFGAYYPKGVNLHAYRRRNTVGIEIFEQVNARHARGEPISEALFEDVGKPFGLGMSVAKNYYYRGKLLRFRWLIGLEVDERIKSGEKESDELFESIAKEFGIRTGEAKRYFKSWLSIPADARAIHQDQKALLEARAAEVKRKVISEKKKV